MNSSTRFALIALAVVLVCMCVVSFALANTLFPSDPATAADYMDRYGGSPAVYDGILSSTDCASLQQTFDRADLNHRTAVPGSAEAQWTLGYMTAAEARRQQLGCPH